MTQNVMHADERRKVAQRLFVRLDCGKPADQVREEVTRLKSLGQSDEFRADVSECVPDRVGELAAVERTLQDQLATGRQVLKLRQALQVLSPDHYIPIGELESAVKDGERRLDEVREEAKHLLTRACIRCRHSAECPASMTRDNLMD